MTFPRTELPAQQAIHTSPKRYYKRTITELPHNFQSYEDLQTATATNQISESSIPQNIGHMTQNYAVPIISVKVTLPWYLFLVKPRSKDYFVTEFNGGYAQRNYDDVLT
jgi:hypothetical protein